MYSGNVSFSDFVFSPNPYLLNVQSSFENDAFSTSVSGEGEFEGSGAFAQYKRLKEIFTKGETAWLRMPMLKPLKAKLIELGLKEDARENMVGYSFRFQEIVESFNKSDEISFVTVESEKSLWDIEKNYGTSVERLLELNDCVCDCYDIKTGDKIRIL